MQWDGEKKVVGEWHTSDERGAWILHHLPAHGALTKGWYLLPPYGLDIPMPYMGPRIAGAQQAAERWIATYKPEEAADLAKEKKADVAWAQALADANRGEGQ